MSALENSDLTDDKEFPETGVVSVVLADADSEEPRNHAENATTGRGTLGLCPPPSNEVVPVVFGDNGVVSEADDVDSDNELPEALRLLALVGTDEDPYDEGGPWAYADAEDLGGRCFFITQNATYLGTDLVLMTPEQIVAAVAKKGMTRWASILHDKDRYSVEEAAKIPSAVAGAPKADHFHIAVERKSFASLGVIARAFKVPPSAVELKPQGAFLDLVEYLTHEHPNQVAKGKHVYADDEVQASFDWRPELDDHKLARSFKAGQRANAKKLDALMLSVMHGQLTLRQVRELHPVEYGRNLDNFKRWRADFMLSQEPPRMRINHYIGGKLGEVDLGRTGKTQLARLMARALYPHLDAAECYFEATDKRAPLQKYQGQPVIIWDDYGPVDLIESLGGRTGVWKVFDDHPGVDDVRILYGTTRLVHEVNIITRVTPYRAYLDDLAGDYTDRFGTEHHAEDARQAYGRFPFVHEVTADEIGVYVNKGFITDTREFYEFQKLATMRANMMQISAHLTSIESDEDREIARIEIGDRLLAPLLDQHRALVPVANRSKDEVLAELLPTIAVYTGDALVQHDTDRAIEAATEAEIDAHHDGLEAEELRVDSMRHLAAHAANCKVADHSPWEPCPYAD